MRSVRPALLAAALFVFASACGGDDGPGGGGGGQSGDGGCSLLGDDEIEAATGLVPSRSEAPTIGEGCTWFIQGDAVLMALDIGPDETSLDGEPASRYELTLDRHEVSSIESTDVDGLGDQANASGSPVPNNIIVLEADEFLELTVNEQDALTAGTVQDLMETVLRRR